LRRRVSRHNLEARVDAGVYRCRGGARPFRDERERVNKGKMGEAVRVVPGLEKLPRKAGAHNGKRRGIEGESPSKEKKKKEGLGQSDPGGGPRRQREKPPPANREASQKSPTKETEGPVWSLGKNEKKRGDANVGECLRRGKSENSAEGTKGGVRLKAAAKGGLQNRGGRKVQLRREREKEERKKAGSSVTFAKKTRDVGSPEGSL